MSGVVLTCVLLAWITGAPLAHGQGKTTVQLDSIGDPELQGAIEESVIEQNASAVITEFNRARAYERPPKLEGLPITDRGHRSIKSHWRDAGFFCGRRTLVLSVTQVTGDIYEIRDIPLIVLEGEERTGILTVNAEGRIIGFRYSDEPATGTITIVSEPSGAIVESSIGGDTPQTAPVQFEGVPEGEHEFTIQKESYRPVDTTLTVRAYQTTQDTIYLTPTFGYLRIKAKPDPKTIRVDGTERSPAEEGGIRIDVGEHLVTLSRQYYQAYDTTITVAPGQTKVVSAELQRKRIPFRVFSDPSGAIVIMDEDTVGTTPFRTRWEVGRTYSLLVDEERHVPSKQMSIFAEADSAIERDVVLNPVDIHVEGQAVSIENVRADRSEGLVTITYDLVGQPNETYEVGLSITGRDGEPLDMQPEAVRGDIGKNISAGPNKEIYWRRALPEGATLQLTQGPTSVGTSLTVGYFPTDFHLRADGSDSPFDFDRPLRGIMLTGENSSISFGYRSFEIPQGIHRAFSATLITGGNVNILRPSQRYPFLIYIPVKIHGSYTYTEPSLEVDTIGSNRNIITAGVGSGVGGRLHVGEFPGAREYPILRSVVVEGSFTLTPAGFSNLNQKGLGKLHVSRIRNIDIEMRLVELVDTGVGKGLGITFGFTHRTLHRTSERSSNPGEVLEAAIGGGDMSRVSTQQLFRIGVNWR